MSQADSKPALQSLEAALAQLLSHAPRVLESETLSLWDADARVLAADLVAQLDVPQFDNSQMDGYAVRAQEVSAKNWVVSQRIAAGHFGLPLQHRTVARIFTGAPMPAGADAVVMQEHCTVMPDASVRIDRAASPGQWVRKRAEDVARGQTVLSAGTALGPAQLGLAASLGVAQLVVRRKPRVALFSTGDELIMPGSVLPTDLPPGAIFNSNRFFLRSLISRMGAQVIDMGIVPDTREATVAALNEAAISADLIVTSGGVSVGEEDHVKPAVQALGEISVWQISMKPGKPLAFGHVRKASGGVAHVIGLPGNPVSSFVTCALLVRPFVKTMLGVSEQLRRQRAVAFEDGPAPDQRREFLRAFAAPDENGQLRVRFFKNQNSSVLTSMHWANALVDNPANTRIRAGDAVCLIDLASLLN